LTGCAEKFHSMDANEKQQLLAEKRQAYENMCSLEKEKLLVNRRNLTSKAKQTKVTKCYDLNYCITCFQNKIREGPYYICSVCNRILYRKTVTQLKKDKYSIQQLFTEKKSFDNQEYICKTCNSNMSKGQIPCQAVGNKLMVDKVPSELGCLEKLEQILIAQRIVFQKIVIMPKGQQRKIKGAICNVPVGCNETCNVLPRPPERSGIIMLKLKRKLAFKGHVYFQAVRPDVVVNALSWLRVNNPFYCDITVNTDNINRNLSELELQTISQKDTEVSPSSKIFLEQKATEEENDEETEDPLDEFRAPTTETCLQSILPDYPRYLQHKGTLKSAGNEIFNIAPGENKHPLSFA